MFPLLQEAGWDGHKLMPPFLNRQQSYMGKNVGPTLYEQLACDVVGETMSPKQANEFVLWGCCQEIDELDLSIVKQKLCLPESRGGNDWTQQEADIVEKLYKEFLKNCLEDNAISPDSDVDEMWHTHILFMRKYEEDCKRICGHVIYHEPNMDVKVADKCWNNCCPKCHHLPFPDGTEIKD